MPPNCALEQALNCASSHMVCALGAVCLCTQNVPFYTLGCLWHGCHLPHPRSSQINTYELWVAAACLGLPKDPVYHMFGMPNFQEQVLSIQTGQFEPVKKIGTSLHLSILVGR